MQKALCYTDMDSNDQEMAVDETNSNNYTENLEELVKTLLENKEIVFRLQQRGEADLEDAEKQQIAQELYHKSPILFLVKFGKYLNAKQLEFFDIEAQTDEELRIVLAELKKDAKNKHNLTKNRRFCKLKLLIEENVYFSELEMMKRNPVLYEQLIGRYLSEDERKFRDSFQKPVTSFVDVLMDGLDKEENEKKNEENEGFESENDSDDPASSVSSGTNGIYNGYQQEKVDKVTKWGEFEDEPGTSQVRTSFDSWNSSKSKGTAELALISDKYPDKNQGPKWELFANNHNVTRNHHGTKTYNQIFHITSQERDLLRSEFNSLMYQSFLDGKDDFDYNSVDNNEIYDNSEILNYDEEDKYFDSEEPEDLNMEEDGVKARQESSEDELDIYMNALNQHPTVCQLSKDLKRL